MPFVRSCVLLLVAVLLSGAGALTAGEIPKIGDKAPAIVLRSLDEGAVTVGAPAAEGAVVVVVLRGWPGYQCPVCDRQVNDFIGARAAFAGVNARLVFVYPGPASGLKARAAEFRAMKGREWPAEFRYVLDPEYAFVEAYGLRWDAPRETAYPSTFIIDTNGVVRFAKVSRTHGGRTKAAEVLAELDALARR